MAKRTPEQNREIYRRRAERAREQGTTYGKIRYQQDKERAIRKATDTLIKLGNKRGEARNHIAGKPLNLIKGYARGEQWVREAARTDPRYWYHLSER